MHTERRAKKRTKKSVAFRVPSFGMEEQHSVDVCQDGIMAESSRFYDTNHEFDITLMIPGEEPIRCRARVAWIYPRTKDALSYKIGLEFLELSLAGQEKLKEITER